MTAETARQILPTVKTFKEFWKSAGPFKYALTSAAFPDMQLEPEEWLFSDNSTALLKALMKWDENKMKIIRAPVSKKNKAPFMPEDISDWRIKNFPEKWMGFSCSSFTPAGYIPQSVAIKADNETEGEIEAAFFNSLARSISQIGYILLEPLPGQSVAWTDDFLREWQEDEDEDGGFE